MTDTPADVVRRTQQAASEASGEETSPSPADGPPWPCPYPGCDRLVVAERQLITHWHRVHPDAGECPGVGGEVDVAIADGGDVDVTGQAALSDFC